MALFDPQLRDFKHNRHHFKTSIDKALAKKFCCGGLRDLTKNRRSFFQDLPALGAAVEVSGDIGTNGLASGLNPPGACWSIGNGGGGEKGIPRMDGVAITVDPRGMGYAIIVGWPWQVKGPGIQAGFIHYLDSD